MVTSYNNDDRYIKNKNTEKDESSEIDKAHKNMDILYSSNQKIKADIETISSKN